MRDIALVLSVLAAPLGFAQGQRAIDGASAPRWEPRTGWVAAVPSTYGVTNEGGALVFHAEGAGKELPWQITLNEDEIAGESRYLLVRYQADGLSNQPGNYFVHGWEGTVGGLTYAFSDEIEPDGAWHTLAVDLLKLPTQGDTTQIAVKVIVGAGGSARLTIERLWFGDGVPEGAKIARPSTGEARSLALDWRQVRKLEPAPGWTTSPATDYGAVPNGSAVTFSVRGSGKQMRWPLALPQSVDLGALPYLSLRYQASGQPGPTTYAVWLGDDASGQGQHACVPLSAQELRADGQWHNVTVELKERFTATQLAVGLDCAGDRATMVLDTITFSSAPPSWPVAQVLAYESRTSPWPDGQEGLTVLPLTVAGGKPSPFLARRLGLSDWFSTLQVTVDQVPFAVPDRPEGASQSGVAALGSLEMPLPATVREIYLLTAAAAPSTEPWGIDWAHPRPVEMLSEPEKVVFEIRYAQGPPDLVLPLDVASGQWGMKRGLSVVAVHPDSQRRPTALLLHDRMETATFAILGATVRTDAPRAPEPTWAHLSYPPPPAGGLGTAAVRKLQAVWETDRGLTWSRDLVRTWPGTLAWAKGPVFEVEIGGKKLPDEGWRPFTPMSVLTPGGGHSWSVRNAEAKLSATVTTGPSRAGGMTLLLTLTNEGTEPVTATVRFPVLKGIRIGTAEDTWYVSGKRGGIINHVPVSFRDPLGEPHPLQMDGFFSPKLGIALACLTHDRSAQHHFIRFAKTAEGGEWAPEYVERDIAPGHSFIATEAELLPCEGDWRAIFGAYCNWLKTWFVAPAAKPWWERTFAFITRNAHYDAFADPKQRGAIQPAVDNSLKYLGLCDYVHLYGWSSSKTYGDWGDYDHYDETVGGLDHFRNNIAQARRAGVAVGLYQDGYLSCDKGQSVGAHAKEWAMKRSDGSLNYIKEYDAYNECPYMEGWRKYLAEVYARVHRETGVKGMYVDEYGATDGRWLCCAKDHGHNGYEVPYGGEVEMLKGIRQAVGPEVALYSEYPPAEVSRRYLDGSFTYQALWSVEQEPLAPHFIDLPRFAFPEFKQFHIIYYVAPRAGNWWLLKFPFFNGESYDIGEPNLSGYDAAAMAFQRCAVEALCAHREAFSSHNVEPLVRTELPGVFANAFTATRETVWTLYNANGHSIHAPCLRVKHVPGATYENAWEGKPLQPQIKDGFALIAVDLGPKAIGCVLQKRG